MYLVLGNLIAIGMLVMLAVEVDRGGATWQFLALTQFLMNVGLIMSDVMANALAVEYSQRCNDTQGVVQNWCFLLSQLPCTSRTCYSVTCCSVTLRHTFATFDAIL